MDSSKVKSFVIDLRVLCLTSKDSFHNELEVVKRLCKYFSLADSLEVFVQARSRAGIEKTVSSLKPKKPEINQAFALETDGSQKVFCETCRMKNRHKLLSGGKNISSFSAPRDRQSPNHFQYQL